MTKNSVITVSPNSGYELIDAGEGMRLERFGDIRLMRPDIRAQHPRSLPSDTWQQIHARFTESGPSRGTWSHNTAMPESWESEFIVGNEKFQFILKKTRFKHVGIFPEQFSNWEYIAENVQRIRSRREPQFLNLFAYTGAASIVASRFGAQVTHVDSVRQVITWAKENSELNHETGIRWIPDDAVKFLRREVRRGNRYDGIIMDPPSYGIGAKGERWKINERMPELLDLAAQVINPDQHFLIINVYSPSYTQDDFMKDLHISNLHNDIDYFGTLNLLSKNDISLPTGDLVRISRNVN